MIKVGDVVKWSNRSGGCICNSGKHTICNLLQRHTQYQGTVVKKVGPWLKVWLFDDCDEYSCYSCPSVRKQNCVDSIECGTPSSYTQVVHESRVTTKLS